VALPGDLRRAMREVLREELRRAAELKASLYNVSVSANANAFPEDLVPTHAPCIFRIYACFDASGVLSVARTRGGTTTTEALNGGDPLVAGAAYVFDVVVEEGESINLRYSADATALKLSVVEIGAMV